MTLISVQGWDKLLAVNVDNHQHIWFEPSQEEKPVGLIHTYTLSSLL